MTGKPTTRTADDGGGGGWSLPRVLVCAPHGRDERLIVAALARQGLGADGCGSAADGWVEITVADEGIGCSRDRVDPDSAGGRFGLFSLRERAAAMGGRVQIDTRPGQGCRVTLRLPVKPVKPVKTRRPPGHDPPPEERQHAVSV